MGRGSLPPPKTPPPLSDLQAWFLRMGHGSLTHYRVGNPTNVGLYEVRSFPSPCPPPFLFLPQWGPGGAQTPKHFLRILSSEIAPSEIRSEHAIALVILCNIFPIDDGCRTQNYA